MGRFIDLSEENILEIQKNSMRKRYERGAVLFTEEDEADGLYIIMQGYVKVYQTSESGKEKTLAIVTVGDVIGEMAAFGQHFRSASVKAMEATEVVYIPQQRFEGLLTKMPALSLRITEIVTERLRRTNRQIAQLVNSNSRTKVLCQLVNLAELSGKEDRRGILIPLRLTHGDIASLAGVARETVTKVFHELEAQGIIAFENRKMIISSLDKLKKDISLR